MEIRPKCGILQQFLITNRNLSKQAQHNFRTRAAIGEMFVPRGSACRPDLNALLIVWSRLKGH